MKRHALVLVMGILLVGAAACQPRDSGVEAAREADTERVLTEAERQFLQQAADSQTLEINMARVAQERSENQDIRDFAQDLASDHKSELDSLNELMRDTQVQYAPQDRDREKLDALARLSGPEFDRQYLDAVVENHEKSIESYRQQLNTAQNPEVREYVREVLPTLEEHLRNAIELRREFVVS